MYYLLTGGTGLLGQFLMREALSGGLPLAVMVRESKMQSTRERIEEALQRWEHQLGRYLTRPVVLRGDLHQQDLGLSAADRHWLAHRCTAIIHSAASIAFHAVEDSGEPYQTNVQGTRRLLQLCQESDIRVFHHVSTAYVCGQQSGTVKEDSVGEEQSFGNDYERSKFQAERLVLTCPHLTSTTIYRPSIIVGDSQTGFTPTYHGIYTPLRLFHAAPRRWVPPVNAWLEQLGLSGAERKNLVSVDWVARMILHIAERRELHDKIYHLTNPTAVAVRDLASAFLEAVDSIESPQYSAAPAESPSDALPTEGFREQMDTYRSYLRDDPQFDATNSRQAAPQLPCPALDHAGLVSLARFAIEDRFGYRRRSEVTIELDVHRLLQPLLVRQPSMNDSDGEKDSQGEPDPSFLRPRPTRLEEWSIELRVSGPGGGVWQISFDDAAPVSAREGAGWPANVTVSLNVRTLTDLIGDRLNLEQAVYGGRLLIEGIAREFETATARFVSLLIWLRTSLT